MNSFKQRFCVDCNKAVETYSDMVYRICFAVAGNREDAGDAFQETFLRLVKYKNTIESEEHLKAWLIRVASNCAKTMVTSPWNQRTQGIIQESSDKEKGYEQAENHLLMELHKLPKKYSLALYLYYYEEYSIKEIAALLEKKENSIKTLLNRGRNLLRKRLEEGGSGNE